MTKQIRWAPGWASIPLFAFWLLGAQALLRESGRPELGSPAGVPVGLLPYGLLGYSLLVLILNRTLIEIGREGVRCQHGPLPAFGPGMKIDRADIVRCYHRYVRIPSRGSTVEMWVAGVETSDGRWHDLLEHRTPQEAESMARRVAKILSDGVDPLPVTRVTGTPRRKHWNLVARLAFWVGAFVVSLIAAALIEPR